MFSQLSWTSCYQEGKKLRNSYWFTALGKLYDFITWTIMLKHLLGVRLGMLCSEAQQWLWRIASWWEEVESLRLGSTQRKISAKPLLRIQSQSTTRVIRETQSRSLKSGWPLRFWNESLYLLFPPQPIWNCPGARHFKFPFVCLLNWDVFQMQMCKNVWSNAVKRDT